MGKIKVATKVANGFEWVNDMINIENFDSKLLKIDKKSYKNMGIYIRYITIKKINDYENIYSVNPLYLIIGKIDRLIEEKNGSKYLVFDSTDESKELLKKKTQSFRMGLNTKLRQQMVVEKVNTVKISWKLNSTQMMICHWISH